jgi:transposase
MRQKSVYETRVYSIMLTMLTNIQKLYRLERDLKNQPTDVITARRQQEAIPLLDEFKAWLDKTKPQAPEKHLLGTVVVYSLN